MSMIAGQTSRDYHRNYYYKRRAKLIAVLGDRCVTCGSTHDLQFDHIDPAEKSFNISSNLTASNAEVLAELAKCQLLCMECHIEKTKQDNSGYQHGTWYGFMHMKCVCAECSERRERHNRDRREARAGSPNAKRLPYRRPSTHGDKLHYTRGCRCGQCRAANTAYERERLAAKRG